MCNLLPKNLSSSVFWESLHIIFPLLSIFFLIQQSFENSLSNIPRSPSLRIGVCRYFVSFPSGIFLTKEIKYCRRNWVVPHNPFELCSWPFALTFSSWALSMVMLLERVHYFYLLCPAGAPCVLPLPHHNERRSRNGSAQTHAGNSLDLGREEPVGSFGLQVHFQFSVNRHTALRGGLPLMFPPSKYTSGRTF